MATIKSEEAYRYRIADALEAAKAERLPHVRDRHLTAAQAWQMLLDLEIERKGDGYKADRFTTDSLDKPNR